MWEEIGRQQQLTLNKAVCGMSDEYELADIASYLEVPAEEWFDWTETKRAQYIGKFNKLSVEDLAQCKTIPEIKEQCYEKLSKPSSRRFWNWKSFSHDLFVLDLSRKFYL